MLSKGDLAYASALYSGVKGDPSLSVRVEESPLFHLAGIVLDLIQVHRLVTPLPTGHLSCRLSTLDDVAG